MKTFKHVVGLVYACALIYPMAEAATVSFSPGPGSYPSGASFIEQVIVTGVTDLSAYQFDLGFDPTMLEVDSVTEGSFLGTKGATVFLPGSVDNTSGNVTFIADALQGGGAGATGNGILAMITFKAIGGGSSNINLVNLTLLDSNLAGIAATTTGAQITVSGTPEPFSVLLAGAGLLMLWVLRQIKSGSA